MTTHKRDIMREQRTAPSSERAGEEGAFPLVWHWRTHLPERKGQPCRIVGAGSMNSVLVEFEDGVRVLASRYAVRRKA